MISSHWSGRPDPRGPTLPYREDVNVRTLRPAVAADIEALVAIDNTNPGPWSAGRFEAILGKDASALEEVLVAQLDGRVDGFIVYSRVLDEVSVHNIAVCPGQRGRGVGSLLLAGLLERMRVAGVSRCLLEVRASNAAALGLYEKLGFVLDGKRKQYYPGRGGREDALLLSRNV